MAKRKEPDNNYFKFYNANPKNKKTTDCVIRAISTAENVNYYDILGLLVDISIDCGYHINDKDCYEKLLSGLGWIKHSQPRKKDNTKFTGIEFINDIATERTYIMRIGGHHLSCIVNGKFNDIFDCSYDCVGNYWTKD